jgi:hypothetical protein
MLSIGAPIFIIVPDESNEPVLHPGKVLESDACTIVAEFDHMQALPCGLNVHAYIQSDGKFYRQKAIVKETDRAKPNPVMAFERVGPEVSAEKRGSYRVRISRATLTAKIGEEKLCTVTDISPEGFAAISGREWDFGSTLPIRIEYEEQVLEGPARMQSISKLANGKYRYGFLIPERNAKMRRSLERIAFMIQRLHLRTTAGFRALDSNVEVNGETVHSAIDGIGDFKETALRILAKQGIVNPQPGEWYDQQAWLNALNVISEKMGPEALYDIGLKIPDNWLFPPGIDSLDKALSAIDTAFHMNHRNGLIGHYYFSVVGENSYEVVCENSYPCDLDRGLLAAFCARLQAKGSERRAVVTHVDSKPCRKKGDNSCTFRITW